MTNRPKGWVCLHRKFLDWEWWDDLPVRTLFIYMLLAANYEETECQGKSLRRGELLTSRSKLCKATGLTEQQVKRAMQTLQTTSEITSKTTSKNTIILICKYDDYQHTNNQQNNQPQTQQTTSTAKERKEAKERKLITNKQTTPPIIPPKTGGIGVISEKETFDLFRKSYPGIKRGLDTEFSSFQKKHKDWRAVLPRLEASLEAQISARQMLSAAGEFVPSWKHLSTWIAQRCWEEEVGVAPEPSTGRTFEVEGRFFPEAKYQKMKASGEIVLGPNGKMIFKHR